MFKKKLKGFLKETEVSKRSLDLEVDRNLDEHSFPPNSVSTPATVSSSVVLARPYGVRENPHRKEDSLNWEDELQLSQWFKSIRSFSGKVPRGLRKLSWNSSLPVHPGFKRRWIVLSQGKRSSVVEALFLKWLWSELTKIELMFLFDTKQFHSSLYMSECFRISNILGKKELRRRLRKIHEFFQVGPNLSHERFIGFRSLTIEISQEISELPQVQKYTGWARHQRVAKGAQGRTIPLDWSLLLEPDIVERSHPFQSFLQLLWDFSLFQGRAKIPLKSPLAEDENS